MDLYTRQRGFTLIELMIVMAIIAIAAAYAVPAYQDYVARGRVGEGLALAASARVTVSENAVMGTALDAGYSPPAATANVASIGIDKNTGQITIHYTARVASEPGTLVLMPSSASGQGSGASGAPEDRQALTQGAMARGSLHWECFSAGKAASAAGGPVPAESATLAARLAPGECR